MTDLLAACATDVLVSFAESLRVSAGLLAVAAGCGALSGVAAAALLYVFCLKPMLLTRQGHNARRLLEPDAGELDRDQSDRVSTGRTEAAASGGGGAHDKEKKKPPVSSDVAAFASRAKVVYPINQKYRPLADGASNPSVHEHTKLPAMPDDSSSSSSDGESLSREQDNDDSSQFISSSLFPKSLQNQSFTRVSHYPLTLTQPGFEGRIGLYCRALQDVQQHCAQLREEKSQMFLQTVKMIFSGRFPKDKKYADFSKNILQMQEKELAELNRQWPTGLGEEEDGAPCSLEDMERAQKDLLERGLQVSSCFSRQVEDLCQQLLKKAGVFPPEEAQDAALSLVQTLLSAETHLMNSQEAELKAVQQKLLWWEELTALLRSQPALLSREASLRLGLAAAALERLTSDGLLTFGRMEKILSEVRATLSEGLQQCTEECARKTKELLDDRCSRMESKRKKLLRSQTKERSCALQPKPTRDPCDPERLAEVYRELLTKHRQQLCDLERQQDGRVADALCDHWKKLRASWSKRLGDRVKDAVLGSVPARSEVSARRCEELWAELELQLAAQMQRAEGATKLQLEDAGARLDHDAQVWDEEMSLVQARLQHLSEQQRTVLRAAVARQSYALNSRVARLIEKKHEHLLGAVRRHFVVRHFCLHALKEMRLSKLKAQTDFRELPAEEEPDSALKSSSASLAQRHLGPESQLVGHSFQQEFLSELDTGAELLQSHAQLLVGNALSHAVQQAMEAPPPAASPPHEAGLKSHLTEAASESVYVTKDSLAALVQSYYCHLEDIVGTAAPDQVHVSQEWEELQEGRRQLSSALLRELENWGKKPASAEFQQRVALHRGRALERCDGDQEATYEQLRQRKVSQDRNAERSGARLQEAEEGFMAELAALARVSLHSPEPEPSGEEDAGTESAAILDLLALNPALTPSFVPPVKKKKKRDEESRLS
ncbi:evC complex member EVC isoform X2 [Pseudoliparis swirei]|uniref:evC complex member EVC isoform X2 n=1 Tax=Pseudoliparis swirei TaxID=2059687 RepID=UPI0024BF0B75|nr:evC complex member EVC isoform X2 [Pseudoliparis swirei]